MTSTASSFERRSNRRRARAHRGQGGFGLLEAIIGMVMVALLIGAGATGLQTLQNTSSGANQIARLDTVLVGASEALRSPDGIPYIDCAQPLQYEGALQANDQVREAAGTQLLQTTASGTPSLEVSSVIATGCDTSSDPGRQTVTLKATLNGKTRSADVVKIDPKRRLQLPTAVIDTPKLLGAGGDIQAIYALTATQSRSELGFKNFAWDCGPGVVAGSEQTADLQKASDQKFCTYQADDVPRVVTVKLMVTDNIDQTDETSVDITIAPNTSPRPKPTAVVSADKVSISPGETVNFSSAGSAAVDGGLTYNWGFDDLDSGAANNSWAENPSHTFYYSGTGEFSVSLTVTDEYGLVGKASVKVTVTPLPIPLPTPRFDVPGSYFAAASVKLDASASTDHAGDSVSIYEWDFGDGSTGSGATPTHLYESANTYVVTLTVEDSGGRRASRTQEVLVKPLVAPNNFTAINPSRAMFPCIFFGCPGAKTGFMTFGWTKMPAGPGETLSLEITIKGGTGISPCWQNDVTRTVPQTPGPGYQTYKWEEPSLAIGFERTFCAGTRYEYTMQYKKVSANGTTDGDFLTPNGFWRI